MARRPYVTGGDKNGVVKEPSSFIGHFGSEYVDPNLNKIQAQT